MDLTHVDEQRQTLEQNLVELRQTLRHWQKLDAEYEGLKEELHAGIGVLDTAGLETIAQTYNADLVTPFEIRQLAGLDEPSPRTPHQIIGVIERRQEYVQQNLETIQRRYFDAENKLETFDFAASRDAETGLPLTEIFEELDDDDNVVSSRLTQSEANQQSLVESLRKAGLTDKDLEGSTKDVKGQAEAVPLKPALINASPPKSPTPNAVDKHALPAPLNDDEETDRGRTPTRKKSVSFTADTKSPPEVLRVESEDGKKTVSFAEKVAIAPAAPLPDTRSVSFSSQIEEIPPEPVDPLTPEFNPANALPAKTQIQTELRGLFRPGEEVIEMNDNDEIETTHVVLPEDESPEDAATRREMLQYHLNEVGNVVAQIDLDEAFATHDDDENDDDDYDDASSHWTGSTYHDDEDTPYTSGFSDEEEEDYPEDELGRSKRSGLSEDYHKRMQELQARLIGNIGPAPKDEDVLDADPELNPQDVRRLVIRDKPDSASSVASETSGDKKSTAKKRVSFAEAVDIEHQPASPPLKAQKHEHGESVPPVATFVTERTAVLSPGNEDEPLSGPPGKTLADTLVERPATKSVPAPSADDPDALMQRRELAAEYYRRRNDLVRSQGGFKRDENEEETLGALMEEKDGHVRKVSRFKAARLKG